MAYLLFIYNKTDKRNQRFQDFSQNSWSKRAQLFFGHPLIRHTRFYLLHKTHLLNQLTCMIKYVYVNVGHTANHSRLGYFIEMI